MPRKPHIAPRGNPGKEPPNMNVASLLQRKLALAVRDCLDDVFSCEGIVWCLCLQTNFTLLCNNHTAKTWHLTLAFDFLKPFTFLYINLFNFKRAHTHTYTSLSKIRCLKLFYAEVQHTFIPSSILRKRSFECFKWADFCFLLWLLSLPFCISNPFFSLGQIS